MAPVSAVPGLGSALQLSFEFTGREFDIAQFEKDNFVGIFDRCFHLFCEAQKARDIQQR